MSPEDRRGLCRSRKEAPGKLKGFAVWISGTGRQSCQECLETYEAAKPKPYEKKRLTVIKQPPCKTCRPALQQENFEAVQVYNNVSDEWIIGPRGEFIGLPTPSIESAMRIRKISANHRAALLEDVKLISRTISREKGLERTKKHAETALRSGR